jgi:hypothetical protein
MNHRTALVLAFLLCMAAVAVPAAALGVEGTRILMYVNPGQTYSFPMAVYIKATEPESDYAVDVLGFGQSLAGSYTAIQPDQDTSPRTARPFVSVEAPLIHLKPGGRQPFNATIQVPKDAGAGGYYAIILVHQAAAAGAGQQAAFAVAIAVPVMLTVNGSQLTETGQVTGVSVAPVVPGQPVTVQVNFTNTGNHHYFGLATNVTVLDSGGKPIATASSGPFARAVVPGQTVRFDVPVLGSIPPGTYTAEVTAVVPDGQVLGEGSAPFTIPQFYAPPIQEAKAEVTPETATTLETPGGAVLIAFPQGAFLSGGEVSVKPYIGSIPNLPGGVKPGATVFSVEGVMGILAKRATITVRYSDPDLAAAGGDPSLLSLARWDQSDGRWTILPTRADSSAHTLTAETDRFSLWAVVAGTSAAPVPESTPARSIPLDIMTTLAAVSLLPVLLQKLRKLP